MLKFISYGIPVNLSYKIGILLGLWIANKIVDKLDANLIRKLTYVVIGLCGLSNVITTLL